MYDNMKVRFADGVVAKVVKFDVEDLCFGLIEGDPRICIRRQIDEDIKRVDSTGSTSVQIIPPGPKRRIMLGGNETKFDGKTQWVFISEYNEVSITEPMADELKEISPLAMIEYYVAKDKISEGEDGAINFYPTQPKESEYFRIELRLNKTNLPSRLVIHQKNGDKISLVFDSLNKTKVSDDCFVFDVVKYPNVEVNDLR